VVLELMVSHEGGVPGVSKSGDGKTSDVHVFQERAQALMTAFEQTPSPRYLVADAKLYHADNAPHLKHMGFITRVPSTLSVVSQVIRQALEWETWHPVDDPIRYQRVELCHYGMAQRWLVVYSQAACERAAARRKNARQREEEAITKALFHLQAQRFPTPAAAHDALAAVAQRWQYHPVESSHLTEHPRDAGTGRPTPRTPRKASAWPIQAHVRPAAEVMKDLQQVQACVVLGTNISASELSDPAAIAAYKSQSRVEGGFRVLKDPLFFVSSLFVKKPRRIAGLWMVMTLALLVYSVTPRRLRQPLAAHHQTVPNQIHQPTTSPPLRWVFPLLDGIHRVRVTGQGHVHDRIESLTTVQSNILRLFGNEVCHLYQISPV
jgi:transposase